MPGEQLTCVWQAVAALDINKKYEKGAPRETLKKINSLFSGLQTVNYSDHTFDQTFKEDFVKFEDYKIYVQNVLREKGVSFGLLLDNLEDTCWNIASPTYKSSIADGNLAKLWKTTNRLVKEGTYPPTVCREEACWFADKVLANFGNMLKSTDDMFKANSFTFMEIVNILEDLIFKETTKEKINACIEDLYSWLVVEIFKKEKVYVRCKKQSNWTTWAKRCCILTPRSVNIYTASPEKVNFTTSTKKIELILTKNTKIESLQMYSGIIHHLKGRFSIANQPVMELEVAVEDDCEKRAWLSALEEIVDCKKCQTTPVQKLLRDRYEKRIKKSPKSIEKDNSVDRVDIALEETHKRVSRAISNFPDISKIPAIKLQSSQESTDLETIVEKATDQPPNIPKSRLPPDTPSHTDNNNTTDIAALNRDRLKAVFMKIDENGNGLLDISEFSNFIREIGLKMTEKEINLVFKTVDTHSKDQITFDQFEAYFSKYVMDETSTAECVNSLRKAFLEADRDGSGTLNFREFTEYIWEKKRSVRMSKLIKSFSQTKDEITFDDFQQILKGGNSDILDTIIEDEIEDEEIKESSVGQLQNQLKQVYNDTDSEELASYIRDRWKKFATFRRQGKSGTVVMKGGHGMVADFVPGEYSLIDLTCFSDLPPLIPKYTAVKGVTWESSKVPGKSGKVIFPAEFDGKVVTDMATTELVRYYGCSFADAKQEKVSLLYRHGIQDFTYENGYLEKYVAATNGGSGIERHEFSHLDCPLTSDSGTFILAKFTDDGEFHITGFRIPIRHTLYIPGGCIHSNDYLKGTWRTMLSDETDIDHVHLTRRNDKCGDEIYDNNETKFQFTFL